MTHNVLTNFLQAERRDTDYWPPEKWASSSSLPHAVPMVVWQFDPHSCNSDVINLEWICNLRIPICWMVGSAYCKGKRLKITTAFKSYWNYILVIVIFCYLFTIKFLKNDVIILLNDGLCKVWWRDDSQIHIWIYRMLLWRISQQWRY